MISDIAFYIQPVEQHRIPNGSNITQNISKKYGSYIFSRDWAVLKWCPKFKVWQQPQEKHRKMMQNSYS